jgi:Transcriptional regulatory protein, C terminal
VERAGRRIELTTKEFCLLEYLMRNAGRHITRAMIIERVSNLSFDTGTNVVDVYVNYLRRKVDDGYGKHLIHTIRGVVTNLVLARKAGQPTDRAWNHEAARHGKSRGTGGMRISPTGLRSVSRVEPAPDHSLLLAGVGPPPDPTAEQYGEIVSQALCQAEKVSSLARAIRKLFDAGQVGDRGEVLELRTAVADAVGDLLPIAESARVQVCYLPGPACPVWFDVAAPGIISSDWLCAWLGWQ